MKDLKMDIPYGFAVCVEGGCTCADACLRQLAYRQQVETAKVLTVVNPRLCGKNGQCAFYRDATPVVYARGFTKMQGRMFPAQYEHFMWKLIPCFGRNPYFERRNGKRMLSPEEQELIIETARQAGVKETFKFDKYEYQYNWKD